VGLGAGNLRYIGLNLEASWNFVPFKAGSFGGQVLAGTINPDSPVLQNHFPDVLDHLDNVDKLGRALVGRPVVLVGGGPGGVGIQPRRRRLRRHLGDQSGVSPNPALWPPARTGGGRLRPPVGGE